MFKNLLTIFLSLLIALIVLEVLSRQYLDPKNSEKMTWRTMIFDANKPFINIDNYFKWRPSNSTRSIGFYSNPNGKNQIVEYDYTVMTNNYGLVMNRDIVEKGEYVVVIGDSFTEGQGAKPWFYSVEEKLENNNIKSANLGILGTGPMQWELLLNKFKVETKVNINKLIVVVIPDDMYREVWNFDNRTLSCLNNGDCDSGVGFIGIKMANKSLGQIIEETNALQTKYHRLERPPLEFSFSVNFLKTLLLRSQFIYSLNHLWNKLFRKNNDADILLKKIIKKDILFEKNSDVLKRFISEYKDKIFFIVINEKNYKSNSIMSSKHKKLLKFLELNKIDFDFCELQDSQFHIHDSHPNENGYKEIEKCFMRGLSLK